MVVDGSPPAVPSPISSPRQTPSVHPSNSRGAKHYERSRRCATSRRRSFAVAAARAAKAVLELREPAVALRSMTAGGEVVEDYGHVGLTLRSHPVSFLRSDLSRQRMVTCA